MLDPRIATLAVHHPGAVVQAIVQFNAPVTPAKADKDAAAVHGRVIGNLPIIHGLALQLAAAQARSLAANPDVHSVSLNTTVATESLPFHMVGGPGVSATQLQTTYDQTLGVLPLWKFGVTGTGVGVAVVDTGVDGALPDFASKDHGNSRVVASAVANADATTATDSYGHGTDVAGIIAGNGDNRSAGDPLYGHYIGVAPNANLVSIKVSDETGNATVLDVIYGLQFAVEHQSQFNIRVINLSLNSTTPQSYKTDPLDAAVEAAWMHGIVVVAAAGNRGNAPDAVQYSPANDPYVITVGGVDENGSANPSSDTIASWSSLGTTQDGLQKPDVYAPGAHIVSVLAPNSVLRDELLDLHRRQRPVHPDERDIDGGAGDLRARGRPAPDSPELDARSGEGRPDEPGGDRELLLPGAERGQGCAAVESAARRPGPHAEQPDRQHDGQHQLQPVELEPVELDPGQGPAAGRLRAVELELRRLHGEREWRGRHAEPQFLDDGRAARLRLKPE